jgi:hypothetical protein
MSVPFKVSSTNSNLINGYVDAKSKPYTPMAAIKSVIAN